MGWSRNFHFSSEGGQQILPSSQVVFKICVTSFRIRSHPYYWVINDQPLMVMHDLVILTEINVSNFTHIHILICLTRNTLISNSIAESSLQSSLVCQTLLVNNAKFNCTVFILLSSNCLTKVKYF